MIEKTYDFQRNMTWAIEPGTIKYIDGEIFGMSVLGSHILAIDSNGCMRLVWENPEHPSVRSAYPHSAYPHSIIFKDIIYFLPYSSKFIISFHYQSGMIERFEVEGKCPNEWLNACILDGELFLVTGERLYRYYEGKGFFVIKNLSKSGVPFRPKRDLIESEISVLVNTDSRTIFGIFDCRKQLWKTLTAPACSFRDYIWDEDHIWYASGKAVFQIEINKKSGVVKPEKILDFNIENNFVSFVKHKGTLLVFLEQTGKVYQFDKSSASWTKRDAPFLDKNKNILAYRINGDRLLIRQFDVRDWMVRPGERYGIFNIFSEEYIELPLFSLTDECRNLLSKSYIDSVWSATPNRIVLENDRVGIDFLLATLKTK